MKIKIYSQHGSVRLIDPDPSFFIEYYVTRVILTTLYSLSMIRGLDGLSDNKRFSFAYDQIGDYPPMFLTKLDRYIETDYKKFFNKIDLVDYKILKT